MFAATCLDLRFAGMKINGIMITMCVILAWKPCYALSPVEYVIILIRLGGYMYFGPHLLQQIANGGGLGRVELRDALLMW